MAFSLGPISRAMLLLLLPGCYLFNVITPEEVEYCSSGVTEEAKPNARSVALGTGDGGGFKAYQNGDKVDMVTGGQGLSMITPTIQVEGKDSDSDSPCLLVQLTIEGENEGSGGFGGALGSGGVGGSGGSGEPSTTKVGIQFVKKDGNLYTKGVLYQPLGSGQNKLILSVTGGDFNGTNTVTINAQ
ncbi:MAG: hypothetical protein IPK82_03035 [Polyangiaceae bacterium]|nr:hypothetical protein [Polyangiaceae bacterium]